MSSPANDLPGKKKHVPFVPETRAHGVLPGLATGPVDDGGPGRGQCLFGPARRHDHCGHLSGRGHQHGGGAAVEGIHPRGKHRADGRVDW